MVLFGVKPIPQIESIRVRKFPTEFIFEVGQLLFLIHALKQTIETYIFFKNAKFCLYQKEVAPTSFFFHFLKLSDLSFNIYFEAHEGIKTH